LGGNRNGENAEDKEYFIHGFSVLLIFPVKSRRQ
jgi:hypothetical protein